MRAGRVVGRAVLRCCRERRERDLSAEVPLGLAELTSRMWQETVGKFVAVSRNGEWDEFYVTAVQPGEEARLVCLTTTADGDDFQWVAVKPVAELVKTLESITTRRREPDGVERGQLNWMCCPPEGFQRWPVRSGRNFASGRGHQAAAGGGGFGPCPGGRARRAGGRVRQLCAGDGAGGPASIPGSARAEGGTGPAAGDSKGRRARGCRAHRLSGRWRRRREQHGGDNARDRQHPECRELVPGRRTASTAQEEEGQGQEEGQEGQPKELKKIQSAATTAPQQQEARREEEEEEEEQGSAWTASEGLELPKQKPVYLIKQLFAEQQEPIRKFTFEKPGLQPEPGCVPPEVEGEREAPRPRGAAGDGARAGDAEVASTGRSSLLRSKAPRCAVGLLLGDGPPEAEPRHGEAAT